MQCSNDEDGAVVKHRSSPVMQGSKDEDKAEEMQLNNDEDKAVEIQ